MSTRLTAITVEDYRCFTRFTLELRPLTLLYGWNGAGKSALVRLLGMLADGVRDKAPPVYDQGGAAAGGAPFSELERKGKRASEDPGFKLRLDWSDGMSATWHLDRQVTTGRPMVVQLQILLPGEASPSSFTALPTGDRFRIDGSPDATSFQMVFAGLIPRAALEPAARLAERLSELDGGVRWLGNDRAPVPRSLEPGQVVRELGKDGRDAMAMLHQDQALRATVAGWFARPPMCRTLDFQQDGSRVRPVLQPRELGFPVDFVDAGAGFCHVLPMLVAAAQAEQEGSLLAAEEPESHLHPNAQRALGEWLCDRVKGEHPPTLVLETHSAVIVAAVQLAVARDPSLGDRVGAYWLEQRDDGTSDGPLVTFDHLGRPRGGGWPRDAFSDERELGRALAKLRLPELTGAG